MKSTLGSSPVDEDNDVYYVTTAHTGVGIGNRFEVQNYDEEAGAVTYYDLGIVEDLEIGDQKKCDIAIIRQYDISEVVPISESQNGLDVIEYRSDELKKGATGIIDGHLNQPLVVVRNPRKDIEWLPQSGGSMVFKDMIELEELVYKTDEGDSGGAFLIDEFSDIDGTVIDYFIGGIYKGRKTSTNRLIATRWDSVVDRFGIDYKEF